MPFSITRLEDRFFDSYSTTTQDLAIFRMIFALFVLFTRMPIALFIKDLPIGFFNPTFSLAALFVGTPSQGALVGMNLLLLLLLAALFVGWKTPVISILTGMVYVILNSWAYSTGKIDHDIFVVVTPFCFAFSGWGNSYSLDALRGNKFSTGQFPSTSLAYFGLVVAFGMFTAGFAKVVSGWLNPDQFCTFGHLVTNYYVIGRPTLLSSWLLQSDSWLLWKSADWLVTILELVFPIALLHRRALVAVMCFAALFHFGTWLMFDILFPLNVIAYSAFIPLASIPPMAAFAQKLSSSKKTLWSAFAILLLTAGPFIYIGVPADKLVGSAISKFIIIMGMVFAVYHLTIRPLQRARSSLVPAGTGNLAG